MAPSRLGDAPGDKVGPERCDGMYHGSGWHKGQAQIFASAAAAAVDAKAEVGAMSETAPTSASDDRREIRELLENWVIWRDAGDWQRFRSVWHPDGVMMATWFQGACEEFIRVSQEGWDK